ncbi:MAG: restriction endonuclease [Sphingobacteriales bacterium]|nr:MAG: restriction endonuclease [Sphingobacteriales bacterium]
MATKNVIRVSEFEKLYYDDSKPFKQKHWEALCKYLENINKKEERRVEYFRILNKGVQFTNYVGVIQAGNLTIEVLPKMDNESSTAANVSIEDLELGSSAEKQKWHRVLLQMLKECRLLRVNNVDYANLNLRSNSILDVYLELFLAETESLMHEGVLKKYRKNEGNQKALKGQLQFAKQIAYNSTHQEQFYVRYTEYNRNNIYNQLLFKTLRIIPMISNSSYLLDKVGRLQIDFPDVSSCNVNSETFSRLQFDRKTERYKEALLISKMLLLNYRPDITGGSENVIAILFDMNKLWEEWVFRRLKKEESIAGISVQRQQSADFWNSDLLNSPKKIRPDIVITTSQETIIIDTKWKIIDDLIPSDADLKQMFIYNLFWDSYRSILLYPGADKQVNHGNYTDYRDKSKQFTKCTVQTVNVLDENNCLRADFGGHLLENILKLERTN